MVRLTPVLASTCAAVVLGEAPTNSHPSAAIFSMVSWSISPFLPESTLMYSHFGSRVVLSFMAALISNRTRLRYLPRCHPQPHGPVVAGWKHYAPHREQAHIAAASGNGNA